MAISKASDHSGGGFFKHADYTNAIALVFEPKSIKKDVPNTFRGVSKPRDEVTADVWVFSTQDQVDGLAEPTLLEGVVVTPPVINKALEAEIKDGGAVLGIVRKVSGKDNDYWALKDPEADSADKVIAWYDKRMKAREASLAAMPSFD